MARLEKAGALKGYGEHPYIETALEHAAEDYLAGQRPYKEVYGGLYDHYLTGSAEASSDLDRQILRGRTLDAWQENGSVVCEIRGSAETPTPKKLERAVMRGWKVAPVQASRFRVRDLSVHFPWEWEQGHLRQRGGWSQVA